MYNNYSLKSDFFSIQTAAILNFGSNWVKSRVYRLGTGRSIFRRLKSIKPPEETNFAQKPTKPEDSPCLSVARVCPSSNTSEVLTIGTCTQSFTKIVRKLWRLSCRQTDGQTDSQTDGQTDGR